MSSSAKLTPEQVQSVIESRIAFLIEQEKAQQRVKKYKQIKENRKRYGVFRRLRNILKKIKFFIL